MGDAVLKPLTVVEPRIIHPVYPRSIGLRRHIFPSRVSLEVGQNEENQDLPVVYILEPEGNTSTSTSQNSRSLMYCLLCVSEISSEWRGNGMSMMIIHPWISQFG